MTGPTSPPNVIFISMGDTRAWPFRRHVVSGCFPVPPPDCINDFSPCSWSQLARVTRPRQSAAVYVQHLPKPGACPYVELLIRVFCGRGVLVKKELGYRHTANEPDRRRISGYLAPPCIQISGLERQRSRFQKISDGEKPPSWSGAVRSQTHAFPDPTMRLLVVKIARRLGFCLLSCTSG